MMLKLSSIIELLKGLGKALALLFAYKKGKDSVESDLTKDALKKEQKNNEIEDINRQLSGGDVANKLRDKFSRSSNRK